MYGFKIANLEKKYLVKIKKDTTETMAVLHNGKYRTSVNLPTIIYEENKTSFTELTKLDIEKSGYLTSKNSSLQCLNTEVRLETSFLLENNSYVEDIEVVKSLVESANDKGKGLIIFENKDEFKKHLKNKNISYKLYNKVNLKIGYEDLNENIIMDTCNLSIKERSVIASIINFKQQNKGNDDIGIPVLSGTNWLYDLFIVEPATLAQQFKVEETGIKMLKNSLLKMTMDGYISGENSTINEIIQKAENGEIVIIDIKDHDKKLIKGILAYKSKTEVVVVDNIYHKNNNMQYLLYNCNLFAGTTRDFKAFVLNKNSFYLKNEIVGMHYFDEEIKYLDFEYLVIKEKAVPIIVTNEAYVKNTVKKSMKIDTSSTSGFF